MREYQISPGPSPKPRREIPADELLTPKEDDLWLLDAFMCRDTATAKGCGQVEHIINLRTGHVLEFITGDESNPGRFWIDTGDITPGECIRQEGKDALKPVCRKGHAILRHPDAWKVIWLKREEE